MDEYKHYIRVDSNNIVIDGYSDWQENKRGAGEIALSGMYERHFQIQLTNERGQFLYKMENGAMTLRSQEELDTEWAAHPEPPPSDQDKIDELQQTVADLIAILAEKGITP